MDLDSFGKLVPRLLLPHAQEWAERAGHTQLSKILIDGQFRSLVEKIGEEFEVRARSSNVRPANDHDHGRVRKPRGDASFVDTDGMTGEHNNDTESFRSLQDRLEHLEREYASLEKESASQQAIFAFIREKIRPLSSALGSCTECIVGIELCARCGGQGKVGAYEPNYTALNELIIAPLVKRGVSLTLTDNNETKSSPQFAEVDQQSKGDRGYVSNHDG